MKKRNVGSSIIIDSNNKSNTTGNMKQRNIGTPIIKTSPLDLEITKNILPPKDASSKAAAKYLSNIAGTAKTTLDMQEVVKAKNESLKKPTTANKDAYQQTRNYFFTPRYDGDSAINEGLEKAKNNKLNLADSSAIAETLKKVLESKNLTGDERKYYENYRNQFQGIANLYTEIEQNKKDSAANQKIHDTLYKIDSYEAQLSGGYLTEEEEKNAKAEIEKLKKELSELGYYEDTHTERIKAREKKLLAESNQEMLNKSFKTLYYSSLPNGEYKSTKENRTDTSYDETYEYINRKNKNSAIAKDPYTAKEKSMLEDEISYLAFLEEREIGIYNYLYEHKGKEAAQEYLEFMKEDLRERQLQGNFEGAEKFAEEYPVISAGLSLVMSAASVAEQTGRAAGYLFTGEVDTNITSKMSSIFRSGLAEKVNVNIGDFDAFDFVYYTGMSGIESLIAGAGGGYGALALGISASASSMNDIIERGGSDHQAFWGGVAAGVFEGFFEKFSIGQLKSMKDSVGSGFKVFAGNMAKSIVTNASEETATEVANILYDFTFNGGASQYAALIEEYLANNPNATEEEARSYAAKQLGLQVAEAAGSGALMGLGFGGIGSAISHKNAASIGKTVIKKGAQQQVLDLALKTDKNSSAYKLAQKITESGVMRPAQIGSVVAATMTEYSNQKTNIVTDAVYRRGVELGLTSKKAGDVAQRYISVLQGKKLTKIVREQLNSEPAVKQMMTELQNPESNAWVSDMNVKLETVENDIQLLNDATNLTKNKAKQTVAEGENVAGGEQVNVLTEEEQQIVNTPDEQLTPEQLTVKQNAVAKQSAPQTNAPSGAVEGAENANLQSGAKAKITAEEQSEAREQIQKTAQKLDKDVKVVYVPRNGAELNGKNGKYVTDTKTMYLAEDLDTKEAYTEVFKHEFVHRLELRKAYDSFKNYLFNKSEAFGDYALSRLALLDEQLGRKKIQRTAEQAKKELVGMYLDNFKNDNSIPQDIRDKFTTEKAEKEAVADFVARVLFKGNDASLRIALKEKNIKRFTDMETDIDLLEEMLQKDRNLFQKIVDAIRDFINNIKLMPNFKDLEQDIKYLEERLARVYESGDKKNGNKGEVVYKGKNNESLSSDDLDTDYLKAVESGDMETAQRLVDEAAKENDYNSPILYHGTRSFGFTNFDLEKMDDKRSIFLTDNKNIASTYSGVTGVRSLSSNKDISKMSAQDLVKEFNTYEQQFSDGTTEGKGDYQLYDFEKFNKLVNEVNSGIESLDKLVDEQIKTFADKMAMDFNEEDSKIHRQLVSLSEKLKKYNYDELSTPIYMLLHHSDVFNRSAEIGKLESNIRLMNKLKNMDLSDGVIASEHLGGYDIEVMSIDTARMELENKYKQGNMSLVAKLGKSLVIDGKNQNWNDIRNWQESAYHKRDNVEVKKVGDEYILYDKTTKTEIQNGTLAVNSFTKGLSEPQLITHMLDNANYSLRILTEGLFNTREISGWAKANGYDSVVIKNIRDNGGWNAEVGYDETADIYIIFNPNSVKSADPVTYDDNGNVIPLSERFNTENEDIRYSGDDLDIYTEEQYNNFGWVRYNDVLTSAEYNTLLSRYADYKHNKDVYPTTRFREAVIHSTEHVGVIMYVRNTIKIPEITKIIKINADDYTSSIITEWILGNEFKQISQPYSAIEDFYGKEILSRYRKRDFTSFQEYRAEQERRNSEESNTNSRAVSNRKTSIQPNKTNDSAGLKESAFSMPKTSSEQLYSSDDLNAEVEKLLDRYESGGEMSREEFLQEMDDLYGRAVENYGAFEKGEYNETDIPVPKAVAEDKPTERFARTFVGAAKLTPEMVEQFEEDVLLGEFDYTVVSDETAIKKAESVIANGNGESVWEDVLNGKNLPSKNDIAIGEKLLANAVESNDVYAAMKISAELADIFTRAGQIVQAARLLGQMTGAGRLVTAQRMVDTINKDRRAKYGPETPPITIDPKLAEELGKTKTKEGAEQAFGEIMRDVASKTEVTWLDKWNAWRYFAMLSNPKTHIRNIVGNTIFVPAVRIKDTIATGIEASASAMGLLKQEDKSKSLLIRKEYSEFAKADSKKQEVKAWLKGNKYNDKNALREYQKTFKTEALEFITQFNSNALEFEDLVFKNVHYIHALAGYLQARKVDLSNVSEEVLMQARTYAVREAKKATFNDESALANRVQNFGNENIATNIAVEGILPFKRTPINIVKRGVEYSPLGLGKVLTKGVYDVKKGKITPTEFIDGLASGLTGTGIMAVGMFLASAGLISGGDDDDKESQFEKWLGKQEYAVEFAGKSYTIDWAAPACIPFFIGVELMNSIKDSDGFQFSKLFNVVWNTLEPITNLSMLSGIQSTIEATRYADNNQVLSSMVGDTITSYAMQGVPSLLGAVGRTIDPKQRSWYTDKNSKVFDSFGQSVINNVKSKIPGLSFTQIPKIDPWGREVSRGEVGERVLENFVSPGYYSEIDYDETSTELKRVFVKTGENVFPQTAAKSFKVGDETKQLTAEEYVTYAKAKGSYSFDYIQELLNNSAYDKLTDDEKAEVIKNLYEFANAKAKSTVSDYDPAEINLYKTVSKWERNGRSAVNYYIARATNK